MSKLADNFSAVSQKDEWLATPRFVGLYRKLPSFLLYIKNAYISRLEELSNIYKASEAALFFN